MVERVVIAGAGHGAGQAVATLKQKNFAGEVVLVGDEPWLPYQRPPLSKKYLAGELAVERLLFKPEAFYDQPNFDVRLSTRVTSIDRSERCVATEAGPIEYDWLILATGSRVRRLMIDGADLDGVHYLRNISDVDRIRTDLAAAQKIVIIGAGYIGLEVAAVARQLGLEVHVIEMADRVMSRVVSPPVSAFFEREHAARGVRLSLSTGLAGFTGEDGRVTGVKTNREDVIAADLIVVGIGIQPNTELAAEAGLEIDNGIVVDDRCRTGDQQIYAIGDCSAHPSRIYGGRIRLESVHNAVEQAKTAAANVCGEDAVYDQVPWFWSDQYDIKLQIAGLSDGYDQLVIRGDVSSRSFACLYLADGRLLAVDAVNAPKDFMQSKLLIAAGAKPDPDRLADPDTALKDLV